MAVSYKERAGIIIHSCSAASALWAGTIATIPVFGPVGIIFGLDTPALTAIAIGMVVALGRLFGRDYTRGTVMVTVTQLVGFVFGVSLLRGLIGVVPVVGSFINAGTIFMVTEIVGWTTFLIFEDGKDITRLDERGLRSYIFRGKKRAQEERDRQKSLFNGIPPHVRLQYEHLTRKLASDKTSDEERLAALEQIEKLVAPYTDD
jgi:uncharacterized protein (DUF697 family)